MLTELRNRGVADNISQDNEPAGGSVDATGGDADQQGARADRTRVQALTAPKVYNVRNTIRAWKRYQHRA